MYMQVPKSQRTRGRNYLCACVKRLAGGAAQTYSACYLVAGSTATRLENSRIRRYDGQVQKQVCFFIKSSDR